MILEDLLVYESYIDGKMTKRIRAKECLELVHTNMYETFSIHAWGEYRYFITFGYDYSRFGFECRKFDALDTFIEFRAGSDNLLGILIGAKICTLMAHIRYDLCTKGHLNHPT